MSEKRLRHPDLDEEQTITVAESAVPIHAAAGWQVVEDEPKKDQAGDEQSGGEKKASERPRATSAAKKKGDS